MDFQGLSEKEALSRFKKYGRNVPVEKGRFHFIQELFVTFFNPLILLLLGASFIAMLLGEVTDFVIILIIVIFSGSISFLQHFRAENAAKRLNNKVLLTATVIRNGEEREIPITHITIGDLILLSVGDLVPADANLMYAKELSVDESTLTGESFPAEKEISNTKTGQVFAGTHVVTGEAKAIVTKIGKETQLGNLSKKTTEEKPKTTFDKELSSFSILVVRIVLVLAVFVFSTNILFHHNLISSLLFAIALAVGLTPELMPIVLTVSLSRGALRMEEKEVIVKYLPSIQNLGGMDILCMDKTGTITENNITLTNYEDATRKKDEDILLYAKMNSFFESGYKNPLDHALLTYTNNILTHEYKKIDEVPFDFKRKMLSVIITNIKNEYTLITKGAPLQIISHSSFYEVSKRRIKLTKEKRIVLQNRFKELSSNGFRIVAIARKQLDKKTAYSTADEKDLVFIGFLIFTDPVKKTVEQTLKHLVTLGIKPKIVTGDNAIITEKACKDAGIHVDHMLSGDTIDLLSDEELLIQADATTIFADLDPDQKARIISVLRNKHTVGFLGDGINDAPPLRAADIGISVNNGSDIAKDVADIILMRKSLAVLIDGVLEGRKTYRNTFKYIMMSLSSNFGNMMSIAIASIFLPFLPMLPVQILLINFLYDTSQIAIPSDNVELETILTPQRWSLSFLKEFTFIFGPLSSIFDITTFCLLLFVLHASVSFFRTGWFLESFFTQTLIIFAIRTHKVPFLRSIPGKWLVFSALLTLCIGSTIVFSSLGKYFSFTSVPFNFWLILIGEILLYFTLVEITKIWFYHHNK